MLVTLLRKKKGFNTPTPLSDWAFLDVEQLFSNALDLPVWVENIGNAAAIGESLIGVGRQVRNFAYISVSSGFGGGIVVDGDLMRGSRGNAGEFAGILPFNIYPHPNLELLRKILVKNGVDLESVYDLVTKFDPEWPGIHEWIVKTRDSWSLVASAISAILDTDLIVLGGRMPRALAEILIPYIEFYSMARWSYTRPVPKVVPAGADGEATCIGAAAVPFKRTFFA